MKYLLDTDHISVLQRRNRHKNTALIAHLMTLNSDEVVLSIVSLHEQVLGAHAYVNRSSNAQDQIRGYAIFDLILETYSDRHVLPFDRAAADRYDQLVRQGIRIRTFDLRIAAVALANGLILATGNRRDFEKVPNLVIEDWIG